MNATNSTGLTPIILAAAHGCGTCVASLARAGADVGFIISAGGLTALHMVRWRVVVVDGGGREMMMIMMMMMMMVVMQGEADSGGDDVMSIMRVLI